MKKIAVVCANGKAGQLIVKEAVRACSESPRVRMAKPDFSPDEAKIAGNTLCINENFGKIWRERCKPDVRGEILNRLLQRRFTF